MPTLLSPDQPENYCQDKCRQVNVDLRFCIAVFIRVLIISPYNSEIFLYKPWKQILFFQFEIIINVLVLSLAF